MPRKKKPEIEPGDKVEVTWIDITEDPVGDPKKAACCKRVSIGYYYSAAVQSTDGIERDIIVTTTTKDGEDMGQTGWCSYPVGAILSIRRIGRKR